MAPVSKSLGRRPVLSLRLSWEKLVAVVTTVTIIYLLAVPLGMLFFSSVRDTKDRLPFEDTAWTLSNYTKVFTSEATYRLFTNTLWFALGSLVLGITLAAIFAWFLERAYAPARSLLILFVLAPMATPPITDAMAWALLASPSIGFLNILLRPLLGITGEGPLNIYSIPGMILVGGLKMVPSAYIMLSGPIARFDPSLEEASLASRVSPIGTFWRVTLPLLRPAVLSSFIYFLILALESFDIPAVLGMRDHILVFSTLIYDATHPPVGLPNYGLVSVYATVFLFIAGVLIYLYSHAVRHKEQFSVITGRGYRAKVFDFGPWKWAFVVLIVLYFIFAVILPLFVLVWTSLGLIYKPFHIDSLAQASLKAYQDLMKAPQVLRSIVNTGIIAVVSATGTMVLATLASWLSTRSGFRGASLPDRLTILATAMPGTVIALGLIFFYIWVPLPIYGTIWIIVIALSTRFSAYTTRLMGAAYLQIHKELEEASLASGVPWMQTIGRIVLPLIWPSFARGWLWVFVHSIRDVTIAIMLFTVANDTIGVRLWATWFNDGNVTQASALAVCLAVVSIILSYAVTKVTMVQEQQPAR
jgi:iron(III) transport system permease protein